MISIGRPGLLSFAAFLTTALLVVSYVLVARRLPSSEVNIQHTPAGPSYFWNIDVSIPIIMDFQNSINYKLNGSAADAQWQALIPEDGGLVFLGRNDKPFMLSMFHQLRCLDIVRQTYMEGWKGGEVERNKILSRHCMNYLRQMVLCRGDRRLERVVDPYGEHAVQVRDPQTCRDWRVVYDSVKRRNKRRSG